MGEGWDRGEAGEEASEKRKTKLALTLECELAVQLSGFQIMVMNLYRSVKLTWRVMIKVFN